MMQADDLRFKWDPHADSTSSAEKNGSNRIAEMKPLEEYLDFIEQFHFSGDEDPLEQHVDIQFRLDS